MICVRISDDIELRQIGQNVITKRGINTPSAGGHYQTVADFKPPMRWDKGVPRNHLIEHKLDRRIYFI